MSETSIFWFVLCESDYGAERDTAFVVKEEECEMIYHENPIHVHVMVIQLTSPILNIAVVSVCCTNKERFIFGTIDIVL